MKKLLSIMLSLTFLLSAVSCGDIVNDSEVDSEQSVSSENQEESSQVNEISDEDIHSYKSEKMDFPSECENIMQILQLSDGRYRVFGGNDDGGTIYVYDTDSEFENFTPVNTEAGFKVGMNDTFSYTVADDDSMYQIIMHITHGDMEDPPEEGSEDFDYDAYYSASEYTYSFVHLDSSGKKLSESPMDWLSEYANESAYGQTCIDKLFYCGNDIILANIEDNLVLINCKDGSQIGKIDGIENTWGHIYANREGKPVYVYESYNEESAEMRICGIDVENKKLSDDVTIPSESLSGYSGYIRGVGNYKYFLILSDGIYGYTDDGKQEFIVDFIDSNINRNNSFPLLALDNGDFIMLNYSEEPKTVLRYTKRSADEIVNKEVITVGWFADDPGVSSEILKFNDSHDDIQVRFDEIESFDQLRLDIISGNAPDIIMPSDMSMIKSLGKKGVFVNLYDMMQNDSEINKDTVMPNVLKACESSDGNLYMIPQTFSVRAGFVKTKFFDKQECTLDEFIDLYNKYPDMSREYHTKENMFSILFGSSDDFVDYEKATCNFDSPEFIKILEFCNQFPDELVMPDKFNDPEGFNMYYYERTFDYIKDRDLIANVGFGDFNSINYYKYGYFGNDEATIVGCPSVSGGKGKLSFGSYSFSISSGSAHKDAAWEFIKSFFSEDNQVCGNGIGSGFPIVKEYFYKSADESMKPQDINTEFKGTGEKIPPLSQEERDFYCDYIMNIDSYTDYYNEAIRNICQEEVDAYFAGGQSAQQTAEYIQSRVSIMLSEQS